MDFGYLLDIAKKNEDNSRDLAKQKRFSTELSKSKKLEKSRVKTGNIQRFMAQKEAEERKKLEEDTKKKETLLHLRSEQKGSKRRVSAMLNRTKGANRSVLEDAKDKYNTSATIDGAYQPDEDDYGYESKTASAMYSKLLQQYEKMPDKEYLKQKKKKALVDRSLDLDATKARVKQSLDTQEEEERNMKGHRRRRKHGSSSKHGESSSKHGESSSSSATTEKFKRPASPPAASRSGDDSKEKKKKKKKHSSVRRGGVPPPPGLDFRAILALAAEKQHQPIVVPEKPVADPDDRPLTAKEKADIEASRQRELRKEGKLPSAKHKDYNDILPAEKPRRGAAARIPKKVKSDEMVKEEPEDEDDEPRPGPSGSRPTEKPRQKDAASARPPPDAKRKQFPPGDVRRRAASPPDPRRRAASPPDPRRRAASPPDPRRRAASPPDPRRRAPSPPDPRRRAPSPPDPRRRAPSPPDPRRRAPSPPDPRRRKAPSPPDPRRRVPSPPSSSKRKASPPPRKQVPEAKRKPAPEVKPKQFPPADLKPKQFPPADMKRKQFPPADMKRKQFPPADMKKRRFDPTNLSRQQAKPNRIESDDSEYDSEMDDFIDDGPMGDENDYSSAIKQIFGYDKNKYRDENEDVSDMEADFSTMMSEEAQSAKLAAQEDEREYRKEMEHKKRKMAMKKSAMMGR